MGERPGRRRLRSGQPPHAHSAYTHEQHCGPHERHHMRFGPSVVSVTAIAHASFALGHAPKPHELQDEQGHEHDVQANQHERALGKSLQARVADAPRTRQKEKDGEDEECRTKSGVHLVTPLACGCVGLGAEASEPDEPQHAEGEEEEGDERRVMHG